MTRRSRRNRFPRSRRAQRNLSATIGILALLAMVAGLVGEMVACAAGASLTHTLETALAFAIVAPGFTALLAACTDNR